MSRPDVISELRARVQEPGFFRAPETGGEAVTIRTAHGCLDVLGGLEAEAGGTLAQMVLPSQVAVAVQPTAEPLLQARSLQMEGEATFPLEQIRGKPLPHVAQVLADGHFAEPAGWALAIAALLWNLDPRPSEAAAPPGVRVLVHGNIPMTAGQSSSTALLSAVALAVVEARGQFVEPLAIAQWVAAAEALAAPGLRSLIPVRGDVVNALTCMHARRDRHPQVLRYSAQPHRLVGPVPLPKNARVLALDTGVRVANSRATLEELRVAAAMGRRIIDTIYRDLGQPHTPLHGYLANTSPLLYRQYFRALLPRRLRGGDFVRTYGPLPEQASLEVTDEFDAAGVYRVRTAVDHLIAENEHAEQFLQSMEELADADDPAVAGIAAMDEAERQKTLQRAGRLLLASHHSYRLRLELSCREADWLVDRLMEAGPERGIFGARITGAGGGGTVAALLDRSASATEALLEVKRAFGEVFGGPLGITEA